MQTRRSLRLVCISASWVDAAWSRSQSCPILSPGYIPTANSATMWLNEQRRYVMTLSRVESFLRLRGVLLRLTSVGAFIVSSTEFGALCRANAQDGPRVEVPMECGSRDSFLRDVAALQQTTTARLTVSEVVITRRDTQYFELRLVSPEGPRVVVDSDCQTLMKTAAVIAATLAQPEPNLPTPVATNAGSLAGENDATPRSSATLAAPSAPLPAVATPAVPPTTSERTPARSPITATAHATDQQDSVTPASLQLGAGAAAFAGLSPDPHLGIEALAGLTAERWGGHLAARLLPPRSMLIGDDLGLRETAWGARVSASYLMASWLRLSVGLSGYWISAQGLGVSDPTTDSIGLLAPELEVVASVLTQPAFRAEIGLQGRIGLTQPRFEIDSGQVVYELPRLGGAAVLRILWTQQ